MTNKELVKNWKYNKELKEKVIYLRENLPHKRFDNIEKLNEYLTEEIGKNIKLKKGKDNKYYTGCDFVLTTNITYDFENDLYMTIFYIIDRQTRLYITEAWLTIETQ